VAASCVLYPRAPAYNVERGSACLLACCKSAEHSHVRPEGEGGGVGVELLRGQQWFGGGAGFTAPVGLELENISALFSRRFHRQHGLYLGNKLQHFHSELRLTELRTFHNFLRQEIAKFD